MSDFLNDLSNYKRGIKKQAWQKLASGDLLFTEVYDLQKFSAIMDIP